MIRQPAMLPFRRAGAHRTEASTSTSPALLGQQIATVERLVLARLTEQLPSVST